MYDPTAEEIIKKHLRSLGAEEHELDQMLAEVNEVIVQRAVIKHLEKMNDPKIQELIRSTSGKDIVEYFSAHADIFPKIDQDEYKKIAEEVWTDYFAFLGKTV